MSVLAEELTSQCRERIQAERPERTAEAALMRVLRGSGVHEAGGGPTWGCHVAQHSTWHRLALSRQWQANGEPVSQSQNTQHGPWLLSGSCNRSADPR